jgi:hypothetical protein
VRVPESVAGRIAPVVSTEKGVHVGPQTASSYLSSFVALALGIVLAGRSQRLLLQTYTLLGSVTTLPYAIGGTFLLAGR